MEIVAFIDEYRDRFGVEPICRVLPIAPSTYYEMQARQRDPSRLPPRAIRDEQLKPETVVREPGQAQVESGPTFCVERQQMGRAKRQPFQQRLEQALERREAIPRQRDPARRCEQRRRDRLCPR